MSEYSHFDKKWTKPEWGNFYGDSANLCQDEKLPEPKGNPIVLEYFTNANASPHSHKLRKAKASLFILSLIALLS